MPTFFPSANTRRTCAFKLKASREREQERELTLKHPVLQRGGREEGSAAFDTLQNLAQTHKSNFGNSRSVGRSKKEDCARPTTHFAEAADEQWRFTTATFYKKLEKRATAWQNLSLTKDILPKALFSNGSRVIPSK